MQIRKSTPEDLATLLAIYQQARAFMAQNGNPSQWGSSWPSEERIREDIRQQGGYVCEYDGQIVGTFFFQTGKDIEPNYRVIEEGRWIDNSPYGVIHRLASNGKVKGVGAYCIQWCYDQCKHLRMDTHPDNLPMQHLLKKMEFIYCGITHVEQDALPRLAFEKIEI